MADQNNPISKQNILILSPWNVIIHLSPTANILSQKAQPMAHFDHCGSLKWSLVCPQTSAHNWRLCSAWWRDWINSSSVKTPPLDLFWAFECSSCHLWQTACWHSLLFVLWLMNTKWLIFFNWITCSHLNVRVLQSFPVYSSSVACLFMQNRHR